ncbi:MAG: response regulator, partial [Candidatus Acidiferrales bacterium]
MHTNAQPAADARILVVEDTPELSQMLVQLLATAGYHVETASDGREALERLERESFDLLLLDVWMPRMNGLELLAELRNRWILTKCIVMTGDNTPETLLQAVREQAYQFMVKPIDPKTLLDLVAESLAASPVVPAIEVVSALPHWVELLVPCQIEAADRIQSFLDKLESDLPLEVRRAVGAAFRELLLNAIEWGGKFDPSRKVRIAYLRLKKMLLYRIADPGAGFRLEELKHAAVVNPSDPTAHIAAREQKGLRPGGFGILMAQSLVDEVLYNESRNEVVLVKY